MNSTSKIRAYLMCALFASLLAVCSQIQIPLPLVPINLALFAVHLAGLFLGPCYGTMSVALYLLLGMVGLPVFSSFRGGFGALVGPTGGYLIGYLITAPVVGLFSKGKNSPWWRWVLGMILGVFGCYFLGTVWFMHSGGYSLSAALGYCVLPFLPGDAAKILLAVLLGLRLRPWFLEKGYLASWKTK